MTQATAKEYFEHLVQLVITAPNLSVAMQQVYESVPVNVILSEREVRLTKCLLIAAIMQLDKSTRQSVKRGVEVLKKKRAESCVGDFVEVLTKFDL